MRLLFVTPGFGGTFYCQNCRYSAGLIDSFAARGHTVSMAPMYMPLRTGIPVSDGTPVFYGAVNTYLQEKLPLSRSAPQFIKNALNSRTILKMASSLSFTTDPAGLEKMTVSVMSGEYGGQAEELEKMVSWIKDSGIPDAIHVSNALLIGIAVKLKKEFGVPVYCGLDGEDAWLNGMREPWRSRAWELIGRGAGGIDGFIAPCLCYSDLARSGTHIPEGKIFIVPKSVTSGNYRRRDPELRRPALGFLNRMSEENGLGVLVDAFIMLRESGRHDDLTLLVTGGMAPPDRGFVRALKGKLRSRGLLSDVNFEPMLFCDDAGAFFDSITLLSVPSQKEDPSGLFILESLASGIPVVQPDTGVYPEIIRRTGGGVVYNENTPEALASSVSELLAEPGKIMLMSRRGAEGVRNYYSFEETADILIDLYSGRGGRDNEEQRTAETYGR